MEHKMSRCWPGFRVLGIILLLGLENGTLGAINPGNLQKIVNYITGYGLDRNYHYSVAVRLDEDVCMEPTPEKLQAALSPTEMQAMHDAIVITDGIYTPNPVGNVVAARSKFAEDPTENEHAEWRLLHGGQNSPTAQILENKPNSCLIFFNQYSPCTDRCVNLNDNKNIVEWVNSLFNQLNQDSRAFVFRSFYKKDSQKKLGDLEKAWQTISHAPLFRCNANEENCIQCFDNNDKPVKKCFKK